jgi:hypothetical protein
LGDQFLFLGYGSGNIWGVSLKFFSKFVLARIVMYTGETPTQWK